MGNSRMVQFSKPVVQVPGLSLYAVALDPDERAPADGEFCDS